MEKPQGFAGIFLDAQPHDRGAVITWRNDNIKDFGVLRAIPEAFSIVAKWSSMGTRMVWVSRPRREILTYYLTSESESCVLLEQCKTQEVYEHYIAALDAFYKEY